VRGRSRIVRGFAAFAALGLYALGAGLSGHLSILARRPLLEGPPALLPYRWVCPPPELSATNVAAGGVETSIGLGPNGSHAKSMNPPDAQIFFAVQEGSFAPRPGARSVDLDIQPECADKFPPLPSGLKAASNVYRLSATYKPGGPRVQELQPTDQPVTAVLTYSVVPTLHTSDHTVLFSKDGKSWQELQTTDMPSAVQVNAVVPSLGYLVVGQHQVPVVAGSRTATTSGGIPRSWLLVIGAVLIVALAVGAYVFGRRR